MQIRPCFNANELHADEEMFAGNADAIASNPDADPHASLFEYRLC